MNKRRLYQLWMRLRVVNYWYLLSALLVSGIVTLLALRQNNLKMIELRDAVIQADETGNDVGEALYNLRTHVHAHMNTDLTSGETAIRPPIQLQKTYERLLQTERDRVSVANERIYNDAQAICERRFPTGSLRDGRVQCVEEYVSNNNVKENEIPKELYQFDFISPLWSPDLAGWSLIVSVSIVLLLALRFLLERWLKHSLEN